MVSVWDTVISLHTPSPSTQVLWQGVMVFCPTFAKPKTQSAKAWPNFHLGRGSCLGSIGYFGQNFSQHSLLLYRIGSHTLRVWKLTRWRGHILMGITYQGWFEKLAVPMACLHKLEKMAQPPAAKWKLLMDNLWTSHFQGQSVPPKIETSRWQLQIWVG